jgi:ATP-dependent Clp protease protease subunit
LAAGTKGKRFALPNSEIMLHQVAGGAQGVAADVEINAKQIIKIREILNKIIAKHTGQALSKIALDTDRDFYLTAQEAKTYGLIDEVIKTKE